MSYKLDIAIDAETDLDALVKSLPRHRQARALPAILNALSTLAVNPRLATKSSRTLGRPTYRFRFEVDEVQYHWAATFCYAEDEETIVITHVFRQPL